MSAQFDESYEQHVWTFSGHRITQFCVDPTSCRIQSWSLQDSIDIRFDAPFRLRLADASIREIDPRAPEQTAPLLTLIDLEILRLIVSRIGSLDVELSDGSLLTINSHPRHKAFEVTGGGALEGMEYVASPGGGSPWKV